jgi:hypothetical protein
MSAVDLVYVQAVPVPEGYAQVDIQGKRNGAQAFRAACTVVIGMPARRHRGLEPLWKMRGSIDGARNRKGW